MTCLLLHVVFLKMKKRHSFIQLLLLFYFELNLNACIKQIYSFICYYKKEKEVCSKCFGNCLSKKCIKDNKSKLLFCFGQGKWIGEGAYCARKIQVLLCSIPRIAGIVQFVDISISKTTLKNFKEKKFRFLLESLYA